MLVIHGEDQVKSREYFRLQRAQQPGDIIEGDNLLLVDLKSRLEAVPLFGELRNIYIENLYSRRPGSEKKTIIEYLEKENPPNLIIWEHKAVVTKAENKSFELPKYLFVFWNKPSLKSFHMALKVAAVEQIFAGLITAAHKRKDKKTLMEFLEIDYKNKTSTTAYDLKTALEFWLVKTHN